MEKSIAAPRVCVAGERIPPGIYRHIETGDVIQVYRVPSEGLYRRTTQRLRHLFAIGDGLKTLEEAGTCLISALVKPLDD